MIRKPHLNTSVATVLASLLVFAAVVPEGRLGPAYAGAPLRHEDGGSDRTSDRGSLVLPGQLVRISGTDATACEEKPATVMDKTTLHATIEGQLAHLAGVSAEMKGLEQILIPEELQSQRNDAQFAEALRQEQAHFAERKEALSAQIASLDEAKELQEREVEFTQKKQATLERQRGLLEKELDNVNGLMSKGLTINPQRLMLEESLVQNEASTLDLKLLLLKARQEVSKTDRSIADLRNQWRNAAREELNKTQQTLMTLARQAQAISSATDGPGSAAHAQVGGSCEDQKGVFYVVLRGADGSLQAFPVAARSESQAASPPRNAMAND